MSFDTSTRNRLSQFVAKCRTLLCGTYDTPGGEITSQLAHYGIQPDGRTFEVSELSHLDQTEKEIAHTLRELLAHKKANTPELKIWKQYDPAVYDLIQEQGFTVLNRLCALRMAEERGILEQPCISHGLGSEGFEVYEQVSGKNVIGITREDRYQHFLFSLFDELSLDLGSLFDRFSPQGILFPSPPALEDLIKELNHPDLELLWGEDETIGWIYQYWNSGDENDAMRLEGDPRNSRELAVRNQFFTPRYIVEFLTDNTLGRIWYDMRRGETKITEQCKFLIRRQTEIFLKEGEVTPTEDAEENISQEELLRKPSHILFHESKDPREIRLLDPACGSMHFGLYAFDLFEMIYRETWAHKLCSDLTDQYHSEEEYRKAIPKLIIENNIHGVDIDARAAQIANLALWLRAQRSWKDIALAERPQINKSNIVCAEPMPGNELLLEEFCQNLDPPVLGKLVQEIFQQMKIAGETGTLLQIEKEVQALVEKTQAEELKAEGDLLKRQYLTDPNFFKTAEEQIYQALEDYALSSQGGSLQRQLFAEEATKGFAFIQLSRKDFDVIVMNPPFGAGSVNSSKYLASRYPAWNKNILCAFIERAFDKITPKGRVGAIYDRTAVVKSTYEKFRRAHLIPGNRLIAMADLGWGVLDHANVETTTTILSKAGDIGTFFDLRPFDLDDKEQQLEQSLTSFREAKSDIISVQEQGGNFSDFPNAVIGYDFPPFLRNAFNSFQSIKESGFIAYTGHQIKAEKYFRLYWERVDKPEDLIGRFFNGSSFSPYKTRLFSSLVSNISLSKILEESSSRNNNGGKHLRKGVSYGKRGDYFSAQLIPPGFYFSVEGQTIPLEKDDQILQIIGFLNTPLVRYSLNRICGQHKYSGYLNLMPFTEVENKDEINTKIKQASSQYIKAESLDELSPYFYNLQFEAASLSKIITYCKNVIGEYTELNQEAEQMCSISYEKAFGVSPREKIILDDFKTNQPKCQYPISDISSLEEVEWFVGHSALSQALGSIFGRWDIRKLTAPSFEEVVDPFAVLPVCPPGMLQDEEGNPACISPKDYPMEVNWEGILVSDESSSSYLLKEIITFFSLVWKQDSDSIIEELCSVLNTSSIASYFSEKGSGSDFFKDHLTRYTKSKRQAPIYLPLSTESGNYTIWLYYPRLTDQTLFKVLNDFINPKLENLTQEEAPLLVKRDRSKAENDKLEQLSEEIAEMTEFKSKLKKLAPLWKPNLNDGVQMTVAPLWHFFRHTAWREKLRTTWEEMERGKYDWAHLSYSLWTERVIKKCVKDRSLAVNHGHEEDLWQSETNSRGNLKWKPKDNAEEIAKDLIKEAKI